MVNKKASRTEAFIMKKVQTRGFWRDIFGGGWR